MQNGVGDGDVTVQKAREKQGFFRRNLKLAAGIVAARLVPRGTRADIFAALDATGVPTVVTGPLGAVHLTSRAYNDLCGGGASVSPQVLIGPSAENAGALYRLLRAARRGEDLSERVTLQAGDFNVRLLAAPGRVIWTFDRAGDPAGNHAGAGSADPGGTEVAPLAQLDPQAAKLLAIGQLAGGVAHDFNNLLTAILGYCSLLIARHPVGDPSFNDLMQIQQTANRAANLTRQLLAFSRRQVLRTRPVSLIDTLADTAHLISRMLGERIALDIRHDRALWLVNIDPTQLEQVIINLAVNARDAMPDGGRLEIHTRNILAGSAPPVDGENAVGDFVRVEVADTGCGMTADQLTRIFEPFFTTKEAGQGTGLGLSTVHGIVHQMGGYIDVTSEPGVGTCFSIHLPRYREKVEEAHDVMPSIAASASDLVKSTVYRDLTGNETVLLVEDEDAVRAFAARALSSRGYDVIEARDGEEALEIFAAHDISLVVSDVVMPGISGPDLVAEMKRHQPGIKAIFVSGYTDEVLAARPEFARTRFLMKPFSLRDLVAAVKSELG